MTYNDGKIINAPNNPSLTSFTLNTSFASALTSLISDGFFYVTIIPSVGDTGGTGTPTSYDVPSYAGASYGQSNAWWLCERHQLT